MKTPVWTSITCATLALAGCIGTEAEEIAQSTEPLSACSTVSSQKHYTPYLGTTSDFVSDNEPESIHCWDHSCRGDISGLVTHSSAGTTGSNLWAITDTRTKDRTISGTSYNNSKWLFQIQPQAEGSDLGMQVTRIHNLRENESGAWNMHDPESLVRKGDQLGVIDGGNSWRAPPIPNNYEAGYCLQVTRNSGNNQCTISTWTGSSSTYTNQTTLSGCTTAGGVWLPEPPNVQGRINPDNENLRPYGYMRFTEPNIDTSPSNVEWSHHQATAFVRFRFPSTCSVGGDSRPCGQWADLGIPGTSGHFNIEAAAVTAGDYLVLITKGPKRPEVASTLDCSGGFFTTYNSVSRRVDDGDTHVFYVTNFSSRSSDGTADVTGCSCPNGSPATEDWRHCTGCSINSTNSPVQATFVTRFNLHEAPYSVSFTSGTRQRITDASVYGGDLFFTTKTDLWKVTVGSSAPTAGVFSGTPCTIGLPTALSSSATSCTDTTNWCEPELESLAVFSATRFMFSGEEDNSYVNGIHNWVVRHNH